MAKLHYKYRFYPNASQAKQLAQSFGCSRYVYNYLLSVSFDLLEERRLQTEQGVPAEERMSLNRSELSRRLTALKKQDGLAWLAEVSSVVLQQTLEDLMKAWNACFEKRSKPPTFKKKGKAKDAVRYVKTGFRLREGQVFLAKHNEPLKIRWSRPLPGEPSSCTVMRDRCGRYFISFVVEVAPVVLPRVAKQSGLDLGLAHFAILSDGEKIQNPRFFTQELAKLRKAQRELSRKVKGSANRAKARLKLARIHARIADKREDFQHKLSTRLVRENQAIGLESLDVLKMVQHRHLAQSLSDASWSAFTHKLTYKAARSGREVVFIDRWYPSSKTCSGCGHIVGHLPLHLRAWTCGACGEEHDRDRNAAINIKRAAGLADLSNHACGEMAREPSQ